MKKTLVLLMVLLIAFCSLAGCSDNSDDNIQLSYFTLAADSVIEAKSFEINENGVVRVGFEVPEAGFIKLIAYDGTEYVEWPDEIPEISVDFKTEDGKTIYENISISDGYVEKYLFEAGKVIAEIIAENRPEKMERICLSWAYAADNYEPVDIDYGVHSSASAAAADENGVAKFRLFVDKPSLVRVFASEAGIYEGDCSFYIETPDGERVTGDLSIHATEWSSRLAFLDKGEYIIVVNEISAVASCRAIIEKTYTAIQLDNSDGMTVPVIFGLNALNNGERTARFTADGTKKYLVVEAKGTGTFYDSVHYIDVVITDANGNVVAQSDEEDCVSDETRIDISDFRGEYTVTLSTGGSCVIEISTIE